MCVCIYICIYVYINNTSAPKDLTLFILIHDHVSSDKRKKPLIIK